jgi:hypothetical protein
VTFNHPANDEPFEDRRLPKGTYEIEAWHATLSPRFGWQTYYGAYMFHKRRLPYLISFIKEHCFFCRDLNAYLHTELRIKNVRTGATLPFSLLFSGDPEYHECQKYWPKTRR